MSSINNNPFKKLDQQQQQQQNGVSHIKITTTNIGGGGHNNSNNNDTATTGPTTPNSLSKLNKQHNRSSSASSTSSSTSSTHTHIYSPGSATPSPIPSLTVSPVLSPISNEGTPKLLSVGGGRNTTTTHQHQQHRASGGDLLNLLEKQKQFNTSIEDLREQMKQTNIEFDMDGEVVINYDYDSFDEGSYEDDEDDDYDEEYEKQQQQMSSNNSCESIPEEEELTSSKNSTPVKRQYSYTLGSKPDHLSIGDFNNSPTRSNRSESTIYHPDGTENTNTTGKPHDAKVDLAKDKISSDYKKMMEDPEAFRNEKLKQRKSKYFSKKELEESLPFHPSSGTLLRSNLFKQFMHEKLVAIGENPEKYKTSLLKQYNENLRANTPVNELPKKQIHGKDKVKALNRTRSVSQPPVVTSNHKTTIGTLEYIIEKENKRDGTDRKLPLLVQSCIDYLSADEKSLKTEGLFRVAGNSNEVEDLLKSILNYGSQIPPNCCCHVVSNSLKKFLRQLSTPVFTFKYHSEFIQITKLDSDEEKVDAIKLLLLHLPQPNQLLIQKLLKFLVQVTEYSKFNYMHAHNLGLMFGPSLMKPPEEGEFNIMSSMLDSASQIITLIIENYNTIYDA